MKSFFESHLWPLKNRLFRFALLWLKDRDKAQDAVQDTMYKGFMQQDYLATIQNPTGWMVKTLKHEALQQIREAGRWGALEEIGDLPLEEVEAVDLSMKTNMVFKFIEKLPERQKEIFFLREVEGLTHKEMATYLELNEGQVKVELHRARKKLKSFLENYGK
ncbi:MAG: RNA polymerase sigma factor [Cytophagales bacterium]|uniref:RNA polymerase sigma factor n=1 Tax=Cyclobacterium marinum TaxID=104 RepID=UPI0030DC8C67|nr:RNA polymerase sigma factor [Cytophagales bacterium]|tara:strand:- start:10899 stop:11384 length:486 start_codon:yes stop_codon:yes gene_type:complete